MRSVRRKHEPSDSPDADAFLFNPAFGDQTTALLRSIDVKADNACIVARAVAVVLIVALGAGILIGSAALVGEMTDPPLWTRLFVLVAGLLSVAGLGLSCWRESTRHVEGILITRRRAIDEVLGDKTRALPRSVLGNFYVSPTARAEDVWTAAAQLDALGAAWAPVAELAERPNLTMQQELDLIEAQHNAQAVLDAVGELLNPGATPQAEGGGY